MWTYRTCEGGLRAHIDCKSLITKLFAIALTCSTPSLRLRRI